MTHIFSNVKKKYDSHAYINNVFIFFLLSFVKILPCIVPKKSITLCTNVAHTFIELIIITAGIKSLEL